MTDFFRKNACFRPVFGRFQLNFRLLRVVFGLMLGVFFFEKTDAQCVLGCTQNLQISLDANGQVTITVGLIAPFAAQNCPGTLLLTVFDPAGLPISPVLNCSLVNQTLAVKIEHAASGNLCWGSVVVKDYLPPVIFIAEKYLFCTESAAPAMIGFPSVSDNCTVMTPQNLTFIDVQIDLPCGTSNNGTAVTTRIDRTWKATDANGNTGSFLQKIWIRRGILSDIVFPQNKDDITLPALDCIQNATDLTLTGVPLLAGLPIEISGFCTLSASKTDQTYPICGQTSKRLLRTWQVVDWCANTFLLHVQVIKTLDKKPPTIAAPANLTISTTSSECFSAVTIPTPVGFDDCSGVNWSVIWPFGTGFGAFQNVPTGVHLVHFTATDACLNAATCSMNITVSDQTHPQSICKNDLQITIPTGTNSINVAAAIFDGGSYDNCVISQKLVSRDGINFAATVNFTCADVLPTPILVKFKTIDAAGNVDICSATVFVKDFAAPIISCPVDVSLECWQDFTQTSIAGAPTVTDNCGQPTISFVDQSTLTACHEGLINRMWKAIDGGGNSAICHQKIMMQKVPSTLNVTFPSDKILMSCPTSALPVLTGSPTWTGHSCEQPMVTFSDTLMSGDTLFCFKIKRNWRIIDPCTYDPSNGSMAGIFQKVQFISIKDGQNPVFSSVLDTVFNAQNNCNLPFSVILTDVVSMDCSPFLSITNNSIYANSDGKNASGNYPIGVHLVVFKAIDGCGNVTTISQKITINCTPPAQVSISGKMTTPAGIAVKNLDLKCETDGFIRRKTTNAAGQFVADSLPSGASFFVTPTSRKYWTNGINTFDLIIMQKHILNLVPMTNPFKLIAADINKNGNVTTADLVELRKLILGIYDSLPVNNSWRFVAADYIFLNSNWPFSEAFPEKIKLNLVNQNQVGKDFTAIKIGDLNNSVDPENSFLEGTENRGGNEYWPIFIENKALKAGFQYKIKLQSANLNRLAGFQFAANFDSKKVKINRILTAHELQENDLNLQKMTEGGIKLSWVKNSENDWLLDSTILEFQIECLEDAEIADIFLLKNNQLSAEFYDKNGQVLEGKIEFIEPKVAHNFSKLIIHPNPFSENTTVHFSLAESMNCRVFLMDAFGKILKKIESNFLVGTQEITFDAADFPNSGVYFIKLEQAGAAVLVEKVVFLK
jgi:Secretion system C-terminal sorting domain